MESINPPNIVSNYFDQLEITHEIQRKFNINFKCNDDNEHIIFYRFSDGSLKTYNLNRRKYNFYPAEKLDRKNLKFQLFGYDQLPEQGTKVIITSSENNVLIYSEIGIDAICLSSKEVDIPEKLIFALKGRFHYVLIDYNTSDTKSLNAKKISNLYGIINLKFPEDVIDISNYLRVGFKKEEIDDLLDTEIKRFDRLRTNHTLGEILSETIEHDHFIIDGILPSTNLIALIGPSDIGKGLLCAQLSICYITENKFLNFAIKGNKKVLFCSFEDDKKSVNRRFQKMMFDFSDEEIAKVNSNLFFEFDPDNIIEKIHLHLKRHPDTGIIFLDPFSEIGGLSDINSLTIVRAALREIKQICDIYGLCCIFVHHISKSAEGTKKFSKSNSLGSQGIEAKARVMFEMKKENGEAVQIAIVKGNDLSENVKYPQSFLSLKLDLTKLRFDVNNSDHFSSSMPPTDQLVEWGKVFNGKPEMKAKEIQDALLEHYGYNSKKTEKILSKEMSNFRIARGVYRNPSKTPYLENYDDFQL